MNHFSRVTIFSSVLLAAGCATPAASIGTPAVLTSENAQCHAQIENTVSASIGAPVSLDRTIFVKEAKLFIEHARPHDAAGRPLDGRSLKRPLSYQLVQTGETCGLVDEQSKRQTALSACECHVAAR